MKRILFFLLAIPFFNMSQDMLRGKVVDDNLSPLSNATIYWMNTSTGTTTNEKGEFQIIKNNINTSLIISFIGFKSDTIIVEKNTNSIIRSLKRDNNLNTIELVENFEGAHVDRENPIKIEVITEKELTKAACCDLAGCFETQISVHSKTTNIITNTRELSILGLSGTYNQILIDGMPLISGLNYTYGISAIPGTLIKNIYISQGLASVIQGPESITGQINIILKEHDPQNTLFSNFYYNSFGEKQVNVNYNFSLAKWQSIASAHITQPGRRIDKNKDGFLDLPLTKKYSFYNKWIYGKDNTKLYSATTFRYLNEQRVGGQKKFSIDNKGNNDVYGQVIYFYQPELYNKSSYRFNKKSSALVEAAFSYHSQESYFGTKKYLGNQKKYHTTLSHIFNWKSHKLTSGFNFRNINIDEKITSTITNSTNTFLKNEKIPGVFIENHFKWNSGNTEIIAGIRADRHNKHGTFITPRTLIRHNIDENTIIRGSIGKGWRTFNVFSEHVNLLACNKPIEIPNELEPEQAINYGVNLLRAIYLKKSEFQIIIDFYKTVFSNQISPDYHKDHSKIYIENFTQTSISNSFQAELGMELFKSLGVKIAYNYLDVFKIKENEKHELPFNSKHHILGTLSYQPINKNWQFDMNLHWYGKKKLVYNENRQITHAYDSYSDPYNILSAQLTKKMKKIEVYLGAENILNFTQENPIINPNNPFDIDFDAANGVWGPTKGIEVYIGLRLEL